MSDLISRQAAIDALKNRWKKTHNYEGIGDDIAEECELYLKQVPSAEPERKKGKWIPMFDGRFKGGAYWFSCSECGRVVPDIRNGGWSFCPNCGSYNGGEEDEID